MESVTCGRGELMWYELRSTDRLGGKSRSEGMDLKILA